MTTGAPVVVWFRNDLRLADNPALAAAAATGPVVPLYILDTDAATRPLGGASRWWLNRSLQALDADLAAAGAPLVLRSGSPERILHDVAAAVGARAVMWNRLYEPRAVARDSRIKAALSEAGVEARSFNAGLLNEPWSVTTAAGAPFRVFTPYWRAARAEAADARPLPALQRLTAAAAPVSESLASWRLHPRGPDWSCGFSQWRPGEAGARAALSRFLVGAARAYAEDRDRPDRAATSRLSAHLRFGEIGPRQVWAAVQDAAAAGAIPEAQGEAYLRQLGWREFNAQMLFHTPAMEQENLDQRFNNLGWRDDPEGLAAWTRGLTGYPIVDAGMRELWATGWMHNRVRMVVASFLTKHLLIPWRTGESWFWDTLVDADLANNVGGWQWVAGSGADASPWFRIFNPVLQGEKFDPGGDYVRRWIPELARAPLACIHQPWRADGGLLAAAGIRLGETYPRPIVDHAMARARALGAYEGVR